MPRPSRVHPAADRTPRSRSELTLRQIVRRLNAHQVRTAAGFYGDAQLPGRWFRARLVHGVTLEVHDWLSGVAVPDGTQFRDHNGQPVLTVQYPAVHAPAR